MKVFNFCNEKKTFINYDNGVCNNPGDKNGKVTGKYYNKKKGYDKRM